MSRRDGVGWVGVLPVSEWADEHVSRERERERVKWMCACRLPLGVGWAWVGVLPVSRQAGGHKSVFVSGCICVGLCLST